MTDRTLHIAGPTATAALGLILTGFLTGSALAGGVTVEQRDRVFVPSAVTMKAGDTLVFANSDPFVHNMFSKTPGSEFNLGAQNTGEAKSITLKKPGVVDVECQIHPKMRLRVEVQ